MGVDRTPRRDEYEGGQVQWESCGNGRTLVVLFQLLPLVLGGLGYERSRRQMR